MELKAAKLLAQSKDEECETHRYHLSKYRSLFTSGLRERIEKGSNAPLKEDDKSFSLALESMGPKAYMFLRTSGFPFPHPSTLRTYAAAFNLQPGFVEPALPALASHSSSELGKYAVIYFDEMKLRRCYEYDHVSQSVLQPVDQALVVMVKSLCSNYQQVVYYNYDETPTISLIDSLVENLELAGLHPVAVVSDQGPKNMGLFTEMGVTLTCPYYNTKSGKPLFVFADSPHLMKSLRNHLIDTGFTLNGKNITATPIKRLLAAQSGDIRIAHKLTPGHFPPPQHVRRQKVSLATQLFSNSVSAGIKRLVDLAQTLPDQFRPMPEESMDTAEFLKLMNDWFDIMNTHKPIHDSRPTKKAYGYKESLEQQNVVLLKAQQAVLQMRKVGWNKLLPCQKGIVQNTTALLGLLQYLRSEGSVDYIITARLNQDDLERLFGYIRSKGGGLHDHPSQLQFKWRLRKCMLCELLLPTEF